jgi:hypothetical protein
MGDLEGKVLLANLLAPIAYRAPDPLPKARKGKIQPPVEIDAHYRAQVSQGKLIKL